MALAHWWYTNLAIAAVFSTGLVIWGLRPAAAAGCSPVTKGSTVIAAVALLFTTRYLRGVFDLVMGLNRWVLRVAGYAFLMTDRSPPFRLDMGGAEPATRMRPRRARLRGAVVTLVCAWWDPGALPGPDRLPFTDPQAVKEQAKARFTSAVGPCLVDYPDVAVEERFVRERAGRVLADNARDAMLLVVGDRGIGSSPTTLLGAVTRAVLHEMPSPVAVVHERDPKPQESS